MSNADIEAIKQERDQFAALALNLRQETENLKAECVMLRNWNADRAAQCVVLEQRLSTDLAIAQEELRSDFTNKVMVQIEAAIAQARANQIPDDRIPEVIAVAEVFGWERCQPYPDDISTKPAWFHRKMPEVGYIYEPGHLPDYLRNLNACAIAEGWLNDKRPLATKENPHPMSEKEDYRLTLCLVTFNAGGPIHATAFQRCEAFYRVKGLKLSQQYINL